MRIVEKSPYFIPSGGAFGEIWASGRVRMGWPLVAGARWDPDLRKGFPKAAYPFAISVSG